MPRHKGGPAVATGVAAVLIAMSLVSGCATDSEREWAVAANPRATADEIIDAGHASGIAATENLMVVAWEVEPEDDEGSYQGAWRLYDRKHGKVADGTFGTVREASARIDVVAIPDGFLLTDYRKHRRYILDAEGRLLPARFARSKVGRSLADGVLVSDEASDGAWSVLLPSEQRVVTLTDLPTKNVQGIELTSDGTVWVLLPWTGKGPFRVASAKDGKPPWTTETIPLPKGSGTDGGGFSASGKRLFVVGSHSRGDRTAVDVILSRKAGSEKWKTINATGIADNLVDPPVIERARKGRLVALSGSEGAWVENKNSPGFVALQPPPDDKRARPSLSNAGPWLWASDDLGDNSLQYSYDFGKTWHEFVR